MEEIRAVAVAAVLLVVCAHGLYTLKFYVYSRARLPTQMYQIVESCLNKAVRTSEVGQSDSISRFSS